MAGHGGRFWLLAASAFLLQLFTAPASQLMNEFLRDEEGFSALRITVFSLLTNTPGGIGLVIGGRLADTRGRRIVGAVGVIAGTLLTVAMVLLGGWPMWVLSVAGAICGAMVVPALGVYGPELFPTSLRGRANGGISILGVTGSVLGLGVAGCAVGPMERPRPGAGAAGDRAAADGRARAGHVPGDRAPRARGPQPRGPARSAGPDH